MTQPDKKKKLAHSHYIEIAAMCSAVMLLLFVAVFVAGGGMAKVSGILSPNTITPASQTGCVFSCNTTSYSLVRVYNLEDNVAPGEPVTWVWNAGTYGA